jgi:rhodanese-related sulfurtransferase
VAETYLKQGYEKVKALGGGVNAWKESGYPLGG